MPLAISEVFGPSISDLLSPAVLGTVMEALGIIGGETTAFIKCDPIRIIIKHQAEDGSTPFFEPVPTHIWFAIRNIPDQRIYWTEKDFAAFAAIGGICQILANRVRKSIAGIQVEAP